MGGLVCGKGEISEDPVATINSKYKENETDEFLKPIIVSGEEARIKGIQLLDLPSTVCRIMKNLLILTDR